MLCFKNDQKTHHGAVNSQNERDQPVAKQRKVQQLRCRTMSDVNSELINNMQRSIVQSIRKISYLIVNCILYSVGSPHRNFTAYPQLSSFAALTCFLVLHLPRGASLVLGAARDFALPQSEADQSSSREIGQREEQAG